jgi:hypothetical protein
MEREDGGLGQRELFAELLVLERELVDGSDCQRRPKFDPLAPVEF